MKKKKYLFLLLLIVIIPVRANAVDLKLTDSREFTEPCYANTRVFPSYDSTTGKIDGHFIIDIDAEIEDLSNNSLNKNISLIKYGLDNQVIYTKSAEEIAIDNFELDSKTIEWDGPETPKSNTLIIRKLDDNGNIIFEKEYSGNEFQMFWYYFNSFDNNGVHDGYMFFIYTASTNLKFDPGMILIKYDLKGNVVFEKQANEYFELNPELIYVNNRKLDSAYYFEDSLLTREAFGTHDYVFKKDTGITILNINFSYDKSGIIDGILVVGVDENSKGVLIKYDLVGKEILRKGYEDISTFSGVISSRYVDGKYDGYIVTGYTEKDSIIIKYDYDGNVVWKDIYAKNKKIFSGIVENYNVDESFNGYLLFSRSKSANNMEVSSECENVIINKYTYPSYEIVKNNDEKGNITTSNSMAYPGEIVKVSVSPKDGYTLKRIVVMDENGKEIEVSKDGTFVMPEGKVTVTAIYNRITNPKTVSACYVVLGIILLISIGTLIVNKKKENI